MTTAHRSAAIQTRGDLGTARVPWRFGLYYGAGFFPSLLAAVLLCSACESRATKTLEVRTGLSSRFTVESHGSIYAGSGRMEREVLTLTDTTTGEEYLVVTGAGIHHIYISHGKYGGHMQPVMQDSEER